MASRKWLVVTDLDSSLLNEDYSFDEAWPVLRRLKLLGCPVVFNSSKTLAEMEQLHREMGLAGPIVAENGGVVALSGASGELELLGRDRGEIVAACHALRESQGYDFQGFADVGVEEVQVWTGLDAMSAELAMQRQATEPLLWHDSSEALEEFAAHLQKQGLRLLLGGRFIHVMGQADKADGLRMVKDVFQRQQPEVDWGVVALGDSPNDEAMLSAADVAVVVPREDGVSLQPSAPRVLRPSRHASAGWAEAMELLIQEL